MKRRLLVSILMIVVFVFAFAVTSMAEENVPEVTHEYFLIQAKYEEDGVTLTATAQALVDKGVSVDSIVAITELYGTTSGENLASPFFGQFADGSHIKMTLAENLYSYQEKGKGILLNSAITVTMVYNGFIHVSEGDKAYQYNLFTLRHKDATLRMIGSNGMQTDTNTDLISPNLNNGVISGSTNLDIWHTGKVYAWIFDGNVYAENMRTKTGEEFVYSETGSDSSQYDRYEFRDCISNTISLQGKQPSQKIVIMDNCFVNSMAVYTVCTGSKITNCTFEGQVSMDCWGILGQELVFENCKLNNGFSASSGRTDVLFIDCKVKSDGTYVDLTSSKITLAKDGGGSTVCVIVKTADCENPTQIKVYVGTSKTEWDYDNYAETIVSSPTSVKDSDGKNGKLIVVEREDAKGHTTVGEMKSLVYTDGFDKNGYCTFDCSVCLKEYVEQSAPTIFVAIGYSYKLDTTRGHGIAGGYEVNHKALKEYQDFTGNTVEFGVVMFNVNSDQAKASEKLFENGVITITQNAIQIKSTATAYSTISFRINGFAEKNLGLELAIALYVNEIVTDGEDKTYTTTFVQTEYGEEDKSVINSYYTKGGVNLSTVTCYSVTGLTPPSEE